VPVSAREDAHDLLEVVLDLGRPPEARFKSGDVVLHPEEVTADDIDFVVARVGEFGGDNRAGIARTLHRISAIRNRKGRIVGLTCRVGRAVFGTIRIIEDLVFSGRSVLLLGRPGVGKTTMLREVARVLADDAKKRVVIVDTSNEIAGDGDIPHPGIGHARRMQVPSPELQHAVMIEAVENHMPEVIVIDEMGTELEAAAARTIAERGVQLIATAHGNTLGNLIMNPTLSDLVGGIQTVTLGDEEARRRGTQKSILERKAPPTFDIVVEIQSWSKVVVHDAVAQVVDAWLRGFPLTPETRWLGDAGEVRKMREVGSDAHAPQSALPAEASREKMMEGVKLPRFFLYGVGRDKLEQAAREMNLSLDIVNDLKVADALLTTKTHYRRAAGIVQATERLGKPVYVLKKNSVAQIRQFVRSIIQSSSSMDMDVAIDQAEHASQSVLTGGEGEVMLDPQGAYVRRLQHLIAERYGLASSSSGSEPTRRVTIRRM
jgi:stage III sporulation protein SpoIIIAA/predicted RNA-binding protein Jag